LRNGNDLDMLGAISLGCDMSGAALASEVDEEQNVKSQGGGV